MKIISLATAESYYLSAFGVDFWPPKVDKLPIFEVAKLITFKRLYVFQYLGLIGAFLKK